MTDEAMSPLRQRMIEDMTIRKLAPKTQQGYIRSIKDFTRFLGRSPDTASVEDVRRFQLHLVEAGAHRSTVRPSSAITPLRMTRSRYGPRHKDRAQYPRPGRRDATTPCGTQAYGARP